MLDPSTGLPYRQPIPATDSEDPDSHADSGISAPAGVEATTYAFPPQPRQGRSTFGLQVAAIIVAALGGLLGIPGAFITELGHTLLFVGAGVVEEAMKPLGVYLVLLWWPQVLRGRLHTAALTALGGLLFALIEAYIYINFYFPEYGDDFTRFRLTVPLAMHVACSFIVGLGLRRSLIDWANGRTPFPKPTRNFYIAGAAIHEVYNLTAAILGLLGYLEFEPVE